MILLYYKLFSHNAQCYRQTDDTMMPVVVVQHGLLETKFANN